MIITATPYRISFFGGGTDYPVWFREHGGAVLATSINRYCYLSCRFLPPFFEFKHRIVWSSIELVYKEEDIRHPAVREAIRYLKIDEGLEIHHAGDLPARSGLGSSSSFAVGILHALHALKGKLVSKQQLAREAIWLEQELLEEDVGVQDQITAAYGGLNIVEINTSGDFRINPLPLTSERKKALEQHLLLVYTGISRTASEVARKKIESIPTKQNILQQMQAMVSEAADVLVNGRDVTDFGRMLHESWQLKRSINASISTTLVDDLYQKARAAGAIGGKLLGAGGGGFVLLFVRPEHRQSVLDALADFLVVPFEIEDHGTRMVLYEPEHYSLTSMTRRDFVR